MNFIDNFYGINFFFFEINFLNINIYRKKYLRNIN